VGMLSGDEAYGLSRALRTRDVITGVPVTQYDYFVASDEYGRNSYITALTGIQVLFGPTPYSMRLLNMLLFTAGAVLLFRATRSAFGPLPAFGGLAVMMFLPTLFLWSISLLKEPLYLFGTTLVLAGAIAFAGAANWRARALPSLALLAGLAIISNLRPGAFALAVLGIACGIAGLVFFSLSLRTRLTVATAAAAVAALAIASQPSAQRRLTSALETTAKTHAGHVFTVGHSYKLLDEGFYVNPVTAAASTMTLTAGEAARYAVRAAVSVVTVPWPWQLASSRELPYLPEQLLWYVIVALLPVGLVAGWRRDPLVTSLLAGYTLPTAAALALTNGNVGTLLRLRGMIIPYLIWLSAVGFCAALQRFAPRAAST
jgi:membrane protein implicated in regulation of membrane protease activity